MKVKRIDRCPHCGGDSGFYTMTTYVNVRHNTGWNGEEQYNGEMFDLTERFEGGRIAYCQDCEKIVCRVSTLERQWEDQ